MTQEEKAKAYDEALEVLKEKFADKEVCGLDKSVLQKLFPQLKESEDEKIRKWLIGYLENRILNCSLIDEKEDCKTAIAWLEKQGKNNMGISEATKQKLEDSLNKALEKETSESFNKFLDEQSEQKTTEEYNITGVGSKNAQGKLGEMIKNLKSVNEVLEKKPAWSERYIADVFEKVGLAKIAREQSNDSLTNALQDAMIELSKFLPQPKQEWSEEDEEMRKRAICACNFTIDKTDRDGFSKHYQEARDWLRSLPIGFITNPNYNEGMIKLLISELQQIADNNKAPKQYAKEIELLKSLKPQNTWKPSEEQMLALDSAIHCYAGISPTNNREVYALEIMKEQLKKLRGE